jgi:hypothetical protein
MGVIALSGFRTEPGRLEDHLAAAAEAVEHLRRLGLQAVNLQAVAGGDVGTIATSINYADNTAYVKGLQAILGDEAWQDFWGRAASGGSATQVESSLFSDVDPSFQPAADRPLGVVLATQWRAKPGRLVDFMTNVATSIPHIERMGGTPRQMQCLIGAHPMTALITTTFADLDAYGEYSDTLATDDQWQDFWAGAMADPTADLLRTGLYLNISD